MTTVRFGGDDERARRTGVLVLGRPEIQVSHALCSKGGLLPSGHDIEVVQRLLGHAELDHTDSYLQPSLATLEAMFRTAI